MESNPVNSESLAAINRAITAIQRIYPVIRKMDREVFARGQRKVGIAIGHHHVIILKTLQECGTLSSSELASLVIASNSQIAHSTEKLMYLGLVEKQHDIVDRRKVNVRLTPKGQVAIQRIDESMLDLLQERLSSLSIDELEKLSESFDNIVEVFSS